MDCDGRQDAPGSHPARDVQPFSNGLRFQDLPDKHGDVLPVIHPPPCISHKKAFHYQYILRKSNSSTARFAIASASHEAR